MDSSQSDDFFAFINWQYPDSSLKHTDFTGGQGSVLFTSSTALPGSSVELDLSDTPQSESLASSFADIGITVVPVDPVEPPTNAIAATPSTSSSTLSFPYTPSDIPNLVQEYYPSEFTDSASGSSAGSHELFTPSGLAKRSNSSARSFSQRGRQPFRRDSRPPNIALPASTPRELSPLNILHLQPGPHTEPNLSDNCFDWSSPRNPALLSPPPSSTLETRRQRSGSFRSNLGSVRSHRAASVSGQPGSAFLSVPDYTCHSGPTRRRSTSAPSEPSAEFHSSVPRFRGSSNSRSRSPAAGPSSVTSGSPSVSSVEDFQDSIGSGSLPSIQLPPAIGTYDIPSSYQPSPDFPLIELASLDLYSHGNSSASSIEHSVHSQASPSPHQSSQADFLVTTGFNVDNDHLNSVPPLSHTSGGVPYHDNNSGDPSISVSNIDNTPTHPDDFLSYLDLFLSGLVGTSIFDDENNLSLSGGQGPPFIGPFSSIESAATSPADTLSYTAASPGNSEQSFHPFDSPSPTTLEYGNPSMHPSFALHASSDDQGGNNFAGSAETPAGKYTLSGGQHNSGTHPRMQATVVHGMHGNQSTIGGPPNHGVRPRILGGTSQVNPFHVPVAGHGTYFHCNRGMSTAEGSSNVSPRTAHHANVVGVGRTTPASGHIGSLRPGQIFPQMHGGFSDSSALSSSTHDNAPSPAASSTRRLSRASSENALDPQFEAKKSVYKILTESNSKDKAFAKVIEIKSKLIRSVFDEASQRKVKSTPAGQRRAQDRRSRPPTFFCILCQGRFTTNNNLQNHYRSHLRMDQYRCPRCGDFFRTEGIRKRHTDGAQKCRRLSGHDPASAS